MITPTSRLDEHAMEDLALGSALLGTGGGGDPYIGKLVAMGAIEKHGPVDVVPASVLADEDTVIVVAMSGAPTVMTEKIPNGSELDTVFNLATEYAERSPRALVSSEIGGINSLFPVAMAARAGIPVVDADGRGRATPQIDLTTWHAAGVKFGPLFVIDEKGNQLRIDGIDRTWQEKIMRQALVAMGGSVFRSHCMTGAEIKSASVHGSISLALAIGRALRPAQHDKRTWHDRLSEVCPVFTLFEGKITSIDRRISGGWVRGHAVLSGLGKKSDRRARLDFQNEHLVARAGCHGSFPEILGSTPDLLAVVDSETGTPITTEGMRYGMRATIIGIPCHPLWRSARGIELAGPRYFGWDFDYVPVEERMGSHAVTQNLMSA